VLASALINCETPLSDSDVMFSESHVSQQSGEAPGVPPALVISCDTCIMKDTDACGDCMMTYLCDQPADGAVVIDLQELREMKLLAQAGLVPTLRHRGVG
jgi:hypothetical protein